MQKYLRIFICTMLCGACSIPQKPNKIHLSYSATSFYKEAFDKGGKGLVIMQADNESNNACKTAEVLTWTNEKGEESLMFFTKIGIYTKLNIMANSVDAIPYKDTNIVAVMLPSGKYTLKDITLTCGRVPAANVPLGNTFNTSFELASKEAVYLGHMHITGEVKQEKGFWGVQYIGDVKKTKVGEFGIAVYDDRQSISEKLSRLEASLGIKIENRILNITKAEETGD